MRGISRLMSIAAYVAVAVVAVYLTAHYSDYIYKFHALSMFDSSWDWFAGHFDRPGALLLWAGRFLTQLCCKPAIGIALLILSLAGSTALLRRHAVRDWRFGALSLLPSALMLLFVMRLGYDIYIFKADALIFTQPLGLLIAAALFAAIRSSRRPWVTSAIVAVAGFPLFGFYALLSLVMFAFCAININDKERIALPVICLALAIAVPWLWYLVAFNGVPMTYLWTQGLPYPDLTGKMAAAWPLLGSVASAALLCLIPFGEGRDKAGWLGAVIPVLTGSIIVVAMYVLPCRDSLFHRQVASERCMEAGDWDGVLRQTATLDVTNDILVAYRNIALYRKGQLVDKSWRYSFNTVPVMVDGVRMVSSRLAGPTIFYHSGLANFASRWAFELNLGNSYALERIKYLAKTALINGETALASKYIDAVGRNPFQHAWADKYRCYLHDRKSMMSDPEFAAIIPINSFDQKFWIASDKAAYNVPLFYLLMDTASDAPEFVEWSMAMALMTKTQNHFEELYAIYSALHPDVPDAVKEARLIFAVESHDQELLAAVRQDLGADSNVVSGLDKLFSDRVIGRQVDADPQSYAHYFYQVNYTEPF